MAPLYSYVCKLGHDYEKFLPLSEFAKKTKCPTCKKVGNKIFATAQKEPTFTDKLYPYWDRGLNKVFHTPKERKNFLNSQGLEEKPSKGVMDRKQERFMYESRLGNHDPRLRRYAE